MKPVFTLALALLATTATAAAAERSLLFTGEERHTLGMDHGQPQPGPPAPSPRRLAGPAAADSLFLSSLVYGSPTAWEFILNGIVVQPGRLPDGILQARVSADRVSLLMQDPATGAGRVIILRVGERRPR